MTDPKLQYIDISPPLSSDTAVWPGDVPFRRDIQLDFAKGNSMLLSAIQTTLHIGAHTDAPNHTHKDGQDISQRDLTYYLGLCQVIEVNIERGKRITPADIDGIDIKAPRILFKTMSFGERNTWSTEYNSLSPELIDYLHERAVILTGIDTPSVDPDDSKKLESHAALYTHDMANLEGLLLDDVAAGVYTLIALPLKLKDCDGSPVRAILLNASL